MTDISKRALGEHYLELAVLHMLRDLGCTRAGQKVAAADVARMWNETTLRRTDLGRAIQGLNEKHLIGFHVERNRSMIILEPGGERKIEALPTGISGMATLLFHIDELEAGRRLGPEFQGVGNRRRKIDTE